MNIAVIIIVFLYMTCGNVPNNVYGVNFLDALIIVNLLIGFLYGIIASSSAKKAKKHKHKQK